MAPLMIVGFCVIQARTLATHDPGLIGMADSVLELEDGVIQLPGPAYPERRGPRQATCEPV